MRAFAAAISGGGGGGLPVLSRLETLWIDEAGAEGDSKAASPVAALARGALPSLRWLFVSSGTDARLEATCAEHGIALL